MPDGDECSQHQVKMRREEAKRAIRRVKLQFIFLRDFIQFFLNWFVWDCEARQQFFLNFVNCMCFLKTLKPLDSVAWEKESLTDESSPQETAKPALQLKPHLNQLLPAQTPLLTRQDHLLLQLHALLAANNSHLLALQHKLKQNEERLNHSHQQLDELAESSALLLPTTEQSATSLDETCLDFQASVVDPLVAQLFGKKKYLYRLELQEELPEVIYKERNINVAVNLVDQQSNKVMNSNIVHLCLGVCDANGQWITENRAGENFMKGKTEVEMYHGEGSFLKVFPRDVSRSYPNGKINFVVYSKPSLVQFSSSSSGVERIVESSLIEPLLLKDISIRAKKKE